MAQAELSGYSEGTLEGVKTHGQALSPKLMAGAVVECGDKCNGVFAFPVSLWKYNFALDRGQNINSHALRISKMYGLSMFDFDPDWQFTNLYHPFLSVFACVLQMSTYKDLVGKSLFARLHDPKYPEWRRCTMIELGPKNKVSEN